MDGKRLSRRQSAVMVSGFRNRKSGSTHNKHQTEMRQLIKTHPCTKTKMCGLLRTVHLHLFGEITVNSVSLSPLFPAADCPERPETPHEMELTEETLLMSSFPEGISVHLVCYDGYNKTSGTGLVTCTGGKWTQPDLICASESLS